MAKYIFETTVEVSSPKDLTFRVETTMKPKFETTAAVISPKHWKFTVEMAIEFKLKRLNKN